MYWTPEAIGAFEAYKSELAQATLLNYMAPNTQLTLTVDAADYADGAALHKIVEGVAQLLGFYSQKLKNAQIAYSAYDRELSRDKTFPIRFGRT